MTIQQLELVQVAPLQPLTLGQVLEHVESRNRGTVTAILPRGKYKITWENEQVYVYSQAELWEYGYRAIVDEEADDPSVIEFDDFCCLPLKDGSYMVHSGNTLYTSSGAGTVQKFLYDRSADQYLIFLKIEGQNRVHPFVPSACSVNPPEPPVEPPRELLPNPWVVCVVKEPHTYFLTDKNQFELELQWAAKRYKTEAVAKTAKYQLRFRKELKSGGSLEGGELRVCNLNELNQPAAESASATSASSKLTQVLNLEEQAERSRLLEQIDQIRKSGPIAPNGSWMEPYTTTKKLANGELKTYSYDRMNADRPMFLHKGKLASKLHLGFPGSPLHKDWSDRIKRRNDLAILERQLDALERKMQAAN